MIDAAHRHYSPFLGVSHSVAGRAWRPRLDHAGDLRAMSIGQSLDLPDPVARVLASRGLGVADVGAFLAPKLRALLPDPSVLRDMDLATARLADAVERRERIALFGDYDVDGATSVAILADYLRQVGCTPLIRIPDRMTEGYGPNIDAIRALQRDGARLLVLLDCGAASFEPIAEARRLGLDPIVLDHHPAPIPMPDAYALVDPNRADDVSGLGQLCAAGVAFMTVVGLNRVLRRRGFFAGPEAEPDITALLDLVALGTVADVMPLTGLNRAFVRQGLAVMKGRQRLGLRALSDVARLSSAPQAHHLGFLLGPRINAGGRIGDSALGARLLLCTDEDEALTIAQTLDRLNGERQAIEQAMLEDATAQAEQALMADAETPALVVVGSDWHPGVAGLVASRLKERHRRPAFAFAPNADGLLNGSGRSIEGVDLGAAVREAVAQGWAAKGGGHAMAAGATLRIDQVDGFRTFLASHVQSAVAQARAIDCLVIDAALTAGAATPELVEALEQAGPFGAGAPEPMFALPRHAVVEATEVGTGHLRVRLTSGDGRSIEAMAFRAVGEPLGQALTRNVGAMLHVAGTISLDTWGGSRRVRLRIVDAAIPEQADGRTIP